MIRARLCLWFLLFPIHYCFGATQLLSIAKDQPPSRIQWQSWESQYFKVIAPHYLEQQSRRIIQTLDNLYDEVARDLAVKPHPVAVVLHPYNAISNGFVALAPRRSEWYLTPWMGRGMGTGNWADLLAVHEFRHVVQFDGHLVGFNKFLYTLMGESGWALGLGWTTPPWFLEGDAVVVETALGSAGRGRHPYFYQQIRQMARHHQWFDYDVMSLGSFRYFLPNHYEYGYFATSAVNNKYDPQRWSQILASTARDSYNPFNFYRSMRLFTDVSIDDFNQALFSDLQNFWGKADRPQKMDEWLEHASPRPIGDDCHLVTKRSLSLRMKLFKNCSQSSEELLEFGLLSTPRYDVKGDWVIWSEYVASIRWGKENFSEVFAYNLKTKKITQLSSHKKWFSPTLVPDQDAFVVVEYGEKQRSRLLEVSFQGEILQEIASSENSFFLTPHLSKDEGYLAYIRQDNKFGKKTVEVRQWADKSIVWSSESLFRDRQLPVVNKGWLCYQSVKSATLVVQCRHLKSGEVRWFSSENNLTDAWPMKEAILMIEHQLNGARMTERLWNQSMSGDAPHQEKLYQKNLTDVSNESFVEKLNNELLDDDGQVKKQQYEPQEYSWWKNFLNPHSWMFTADPMVPTVGAEVLSSDLLSTTQISFGAEYDYNQNRSGIFAQAVYAGYYPLFKFFAGHRPRTADLGNEQLLRWNEKEYQFSLELPFVWDKRLYRKSLSIELLGGGILEDQRFLWQENTQQNLGQEGDRRANYWGAEMTFSLRRRSAFRDLVAPLSLEGIVGLKNVGSGRGSWAQPGSQQLYLLKGTLPGLTEHHHWLWQMHHEKRTSNMGYIFPSELLFSRGYNAINAADKRGFSLNYMATLAYPHWSLGDYLYTKRIFANIFYDHLEITSDNVEQWPFRSFGVELYLDSHFFRNRYVNLQWGSRASYRVEDGRWDFAPVVLMLNSEY